MTFDVNKIRKDFPILSRKVHGKPLVYLDNAASMQKPASVIQAMSHFYEHSYSNIHRGVHTLSQEATGLYEAVRTKAQKFINAPKPEEVIFVRGATEGINLVAFSWSSFLTKGDRIVLSALEHHSNIVPWQMACERTGAELKIIPINKKGELVLDNLDEIINSKTKIVAITQISNALGTITPLKTVIDKAHSVGAVCMVDGAQGIVHQRVDVQKLNCDFYVFSGHKIGGPTGIGILYGKKELLDRMPPYQGGGDMILNVSFEKTTYNVTPHKFEAGTPDIAGGIGLGAAIDYLNSIDLDAAFHHEEALLRAATLKMSAIPGVKLIGTADQKASVLSFMVEGIHPHDLGTILDSQGVAIRAGHHCAQPIMDFFEIPATARASFSFYNTLEDVEALVRAVVHAKEVFGYV